MMPLWICSEIRSLFSFCGEIYIKYHLSCASWVHSSVALSGHIPAAVATTAVTRCPQTDTRITAAVATTVETRCLQNWHTHRCGCGHHSGDTLSTDWHTHHWGCGHHSGDTLSADWHMHHCGCGHHSGDMLSSELTHASLRLCHHSSDTLSAELTHGSLWLWPPQRWHAVRRTDTLSPYTLMPPPQHPPSTRSVNLTIPRTSSGASNNTCPSVTGSYLKVFRFHAMHVSISALFKAEWHSPVCISHILFTCAVCREALGLWKQAILKTILLLFSVGCAGSSLPPGPFSGCGEWGLLSSRGARASHRGGFSCWRAQALGLSGLNSCSSWAQ